MDRQKVLVSKIIPEITSYTLAMMEIRDKKMGEGQRGQSEGLYRTGEQDKKGKPRFASDVQDQSL